MRLIRTGASIGLGYVLGTRAGRQQYENLLQQGQKLIHHPKVQGLGQNPKVQQAAGRLPKPLQSKVNSVLPVTPPLAAPAPFVADPAFAPPPMAATPSPTGTIGSPDVLAEFRPSTEEPPPAMGRPLI